MIMGAHRTEMRPAEREVPWATDGPTLRPQARTGCLCAFESNSERPAMHPESPDATSVVRTHTRQLELSCGPMARRGRIGEVHRCSPSPNKNNAARRFRINVANRRAATPG